MPEVSREIVLDGSKPEEVEDKEKREIGGDAVWTLSTAKPGNGVEQLRSARPHLPPARAALCLARTARPGVARPPLTAAPTGRRARRDNNTDTYWQSDGPQPHLVNIQFHKKVDPLVCVPACFGRCVRLPARVQQRARESQQRQQLSTGR